MFVLDREKGKIVEKEITFTPGLYKIFDEIVVNAADNKQRDPNMSELHITIDAENNRISVKNNGTGIPVKMHGEHKCYVPSLIFGELLTGSNFDDNEAKTTGKFQCEIKKYAHLSRCRSMLTLMLFSSSHNFKGGEMVTVQSSRIFSAKFSSSSVLTPRKV